MTRFSLSGRNRPFRFLFWLPLAAALAAGAARVRTPAIAVQAEPEAIPASEFSRLIQDLSEPDGYFRSDNFTSNETSYLHVVDRLRELEVSGGAYIGVGPEQNFTYIAKIRPKIAFIVDIRRQAILQHLLYKAVFHQAENRARFFAVLLSRPLAGEGAPGAEATTPQILDYFASAAPSEEAFNANLARALTMIEDELRFPLSEQDRQRLEYVYATFKRDGLDISFRSGSSGRSGYGGFPTLRDLVLQTDLKGRHRSFLASEEDYGFVRRLHLRNRIIPVVGDFAGSKALASVGGYLRANGYKVSAFYTSNVEQFLFQNSVFEFFARNVASLPIDDRSVFIRAVSMGGQHPAYVPGHRTTTLLQKISIFRRDFTEGIYTGHMRLVTTHYIAGAQP